MKSWSIQFSLLEAVTNRIDQLEQDGIVTRLRDPGDRRGVISILGKIATDSIAGSLANSGIGNPKSPIQNLELI
ncbi:MarR family transcriptional regulator [Thermoleptolyngbya sp.]